MLAVKTEKPVKPSGKVEAPSPMIPHPWDLPDAKAFQMLAEGQATPEQQTRALKWLIEACGTYDEPFRPGGSEGDRDTAYACGKRSIGLQVVKLVNINLSAFRKTKKEPT